VNEIASKKHLNRHFRADEDFLILW